MSSRVIWALALTILIGAGVYLAVAGEGDSPESTSASTAASPATPSSTPSPPAVDPVPDSPWRPVAVGFAKTLTDTTGSRAQWLGHLARYVDPTQLEGYKHTDRRQVPRGTRPAVTLIGRSTSGGTPQIQAEARYREGLAIALVLQPINDQWRVIQAQPREEPPAEPATAVKGRTDDPADRGPITTAASPSAQPTTTAAPTQQPTPQPTQKPAPKPTKTGGGGPGGDGPVDPGDGGPIDPG